MKGQTYMIEAIISFSIMISVFLLLFFFTPQFPEMSELNYKLRIKDALENLDNLNLRDKVYSNDVNYIENYLKMVLPKNIRFDVVIYDKNNALTTEPTIFSPFVFSTSYYIAGDYDKFFPREIRVYVWGYR